MRVLIDSNLILRSIEPGHAQRSVATAAVDALRSSGSASHLVPQVVYELWVVATRPKSVNGLGLAPAEMESELRGLLRMVALLPDTSGLFDEWLRLVTLHACRGKPAHDARLVAAMNIHGLTHLLTFNAADFARFPGIQVLDPADVAGSPAS